MQNIWTMNQKKAKIAVHETCNMDAARNKHKKVCSKNLNRRATWES